MQKITDSMGIGCSTAFALPGLDQAAVDLLWSTFRKTNGGEAREKLIFHYLPLARKVAGIYYSRRFHNEIEFSEYLQLATLGMIEALDRFDPDTGVQFSTFASKRMHGCILDGLRHCSDKQEQIALQTRTRRERLTSLTSVANDKAAPEVALGANGQLLQYLADVGVGMALSWLLEDSGMIASSNDVEDKKQIPYLQVLELQQLRDRVQELVATLPPQQRTVIQCHYTQEIPFGIIAKMLGLTAGRISQIHKQALTKLRNHLKDREACDAIF